MNASRAVALAMLVGGAGCFFLPNAHYGCKADKDCQGQNYPRCDVAVGVCMAREPGGGVDAGPPADPTRSTVTVEPTTTLAADGVAQFTANVVVRGADGAPLVHRLVTLQATGSDNFISDPIASDESGRAATTISSTHAEQKTLAVLVGTAPDQVKLLARPVVEFVPGAAFVVEPASGNGQSAVVATVLPAPFVAVVNDAHGNAVPGVTVTFAVTGGGGSLAAPTTLVSDAQGQAQASLTLGNTAGTNTVTATAQGLTITPALFSATGTAGDAMRIRMETGDAQTARAGAPLPNPLVAVVADIHDNPKAGATVTFAVTAGGGSLSVTEVSTNTLGRAETTLTLGTTAGTNAVTASAAGLSGSPVVFSAIGTAGAPALIEKRSGDQQTGAVAAALRDSLVVVARDAGGNPTANVTVVFSVASGGGSMNVTVVSTDGAGEARAAWTLGTAAGVNTATAMAAGLQGSPLTFSATATAGPALKILKVSGDAQSGIAGSALTDPFVVVVRDLYDNPKEGVAVVFAIATTQGGSVTPVDVFTDAAGLARTTLTLGATVGSNTVTATSTNLVGSPLTFGASGTVGPPGKILVAAGDQQSGTVGAGLANPLVVLVTDANNNATQGASVTFAVASGGGNVSTTTATTDAQGQAQTSLTLGTVAGTNSVTSVLGGYTGAPAAFTATGTAGNAAKLQLVSGDGQTGVAGSTLASPFVVVVQDAYDNLKPGVSVAFAVAGGAGSLSAPSPTDASGLSQVTLTLGPTAGANTVTATVAGAAGSPLTFTATGVAGIATRIEKGAGSDGQSASAGAALANAISIVAKDANGNVKSGVVVAFAVTGGGGSLTVYGATTDANGVASTIWSVGTVAGANTMTATATGLAGSPLTFTSTGTAGPGQMHISSGDGQQQVAGTADEPARGPREG